MSQTIILKHNDTTGNAPITLVHGESAVNIADQKMWVGNSSNTPVLFVDYQNTATTGTTVDLSTTFRNIVEKETISATASTGALNYDVLTQSVLYYTTNASGNWTMNFRGNSTTSLDSLMSTGENVTVVFKATQGSTPYYNTAITIDGNSVSPKWQSGITPTSGNSNSIDAYIYSITKTGSATFSVLASQTKFA